MKRYLVALAAAGVAGTVVLGSAAALNVDAGPVQAGSVIDLECSDGVTVTQRIEVDNTPTPFSNGVVVDGLGGCEGENVIVTLFSGGSPNNLAQATLVGIDADTESIGFDGGGTVALEDIDSLTVTIVN
jgi:hypothetical protein